MILAAVLAPWLPAIAAKPIPAAIFLASYTALAMGRIPGLRIDRAGIALLGAGLMIASGALPLADAYAAIDLDTMSLLLGMMIVVANLRLSGFFAVATSWLARHARQPPVLLCAVSAISGLFSAFLVNDAICLVLAPLVLDLARHLRRNPAPYLLAVAMASNVGSTATITGNPQNIMIGSFSHIPYSRFAATLAPVAFLGVVLTAALIALAYRRIVFVPSSKIIDAPTRLANKPLMARALLTLVLLVVLFFAGVAPPKAAILVAGLVLLTRRLKSARIYAEIDISLLLMFAGLFVIVAGAQHALLTADLVATVSHLHLAQIPVLAGITAVLSNVVSNVPAVLLMKPFVDQLPQRDLAWLTVAMASTLAGNFTILGSVANLIVIHKAAERGVTLGFWEYFRLGAPLTMLTLAIGIFWLMR